MDIIKFDDCIIPIYLSINDLNDIISLSVVCKKFNEKLRDQFTIYLILISKCRDIVMRDNKSRPLLTLIESWSKFRADTIRCFEFGNTLELVKQATLRYNTEVVKHGIQLLDLKSRTSKNELAFSLLKIIVDETGKNTLLKDNVVHPLIDFLTNNITNTQVFDIMSYSCETECSSLYLYFESVIKDRYFDLYINFLARYSTICVNMQ